MYYFWLFLVWAFGIFGALAIFSGLAGGGFAPIFGGLLLSGFAWLCYRAARGVWRHQVILEDAALVTLRGREGGEDGNAADRLRRLEELKSGGLLSDEEYDRQRARIIEEL